MGTQKLEKHKGIETNDTNLPHAMRETNQFDYMERVFEAPLNKMGKYLLSYYAVRYNFKESRGCFAGVRRMEQDLGISKGTIIKWKRYLRTLGWIKVLHRPEMKTDVVFLRLGAADPSIDVSRQVSRLELDPVMDWEVLEGCSPFEPESKGSISDQSGANKEEEDSFYWPEGAFHDDEWV